MTLEEPPSLYWTADNRELWRRIGNHDFDSEQALSFTRRLARDLAWPISLARDAISEYEKFCFLAAVWPTAVTPSEEVDEVWHLHLTYTRDYWDVWCGQTLCMALHHNPTEGGAAEDRKYRSQYAETLAAYETFFGPPPETFWPATHRRFGKQPRFRVLDRERWFALPRRKLPRWPVPRWPLRGAE